MLGRLFLKIFKKNAQSEEEKNIGQGYAPIAEKQSEEPEYSYIKVSYATDVGRVRKNNEDSFFIDSKCRHIYGRAECDCYLELRKSAHIYALFDGMGGEAYGETASALAAARLEGMNETFLSASPSELPFYMNEYIRTANAAICDMLEERRVDRGGCTFAAVCLSSDSAYPFYLGDSRIYLYQNGTLLQITEDHTLAVRNIKAGVYTEEEAKNSPDHHRLTGFIGADSARMGLDCQPCMPVRLKSGVKLLICSDGLSDMCEKEQICSLLSEETDCAAKTLVNAALENGGRDNVTCIVLEIY